MTLQSLLIRFLPLPQPGRVLADGEWRTLARLAETLLANEPEVPPEDVADNVEAFLVRGRSKRAWRVRALLQLVEWAPLVHGKKPISRMTLRQRREFVRERYVDGHGIWGVCAKVRYLVLMGAYGDGRMHASTGYVAVSKRRRLAPSERPGDRAVAQ